MNTTTYCRLIAACNSFLKTGVEPPLKLAVIGKDVSQSQSPQIHSYIAKALKKSVAYEKLTLPPEEFASRIATVLADYDGLNVTIPYKLSVIPYLQKTADAAKKVGAVNTIVQGMYGYSTDGEGFSLMLKTEGIDVNGKSVLMLGAGGAARAVAYELLKAGAFVYVYSRTYEKVLRLVQDIGPINGRSAEALKELVAGQSYSILINATGVGMHNTVGVSPVSEDWIKACEVAIDLIYEPKKSEFLRLAEGYGKRILNGEGMLFYQAYLAECYFWNLPTDDTDRAKALFYDYQKEV